jgi:hypothetical protein
MSGLLVWSVVFGEEFKELHHMWLEALRSFGGYNGDVIIITDEDRIDGRTRYVNMKERVVPGPRPTPRDVVKAVCKNKTSIVDVAGAADHDFLLYLDADVLVTRPRFVDIMANVSAAGRIVAQRDLTPVSTQKPYTAWAELTPEERIRFANDGFCAGMVGFPANDIGLTALREWHKANWTPDKLHGDQVRLNLLLFRQFLGLWDYLPETAHGAFELEVVPRDATFVHFTRRNSLPSRTERMRRYFEYLKSQ